MTDQVGRPDRTDKTDQAEETAPDGDEQDFAAQAASEERSSLAGEFIQFLGENKKWWLAPIVISILLLGGLVLRLIGRDPLERRILPQARTYWVDAPPARPSESYFKQF